MAMFAGLRREEQVGLAVAAALHVALVAVLLTRPAAHDPLPVPERMTVNLAPDVGLEATAPEPVTESRAAIAPTLSDQPAPPVAPSVAPSPPQPIAQPKIAPPAPAKEPAPADTRERRRPDRAATPQPAPKPGGSRLGDNFLSGLGASTKTEETRAPAAAIGPGVAASLLQAIVREVKPKWQPPSGADVEQLASLVRFQLNPDGSLAGRPTLVRQTGVTDANRAQANRHAEQAIRAIQLAAPFALPPQYYSAWKSVSLTFDWKLSQ